MKSNTLICDYLEELRVPHTRSYSNKRFNDMPFHTMFGFSKLLEEYGIKSEGYLLSDKGEISKISTPFLARTPKGYVIVTDINGDNITYLTQGVKETISKDKFFKAWGGNVMLSYPQEDAAEPSYHLHARIELLMESKKWILLACSVLVFFYFFIKNGLYGSLSTVLVTIFDLLGLYFSFLLVQKSANIHTSAGDIVCGVLQEGGCDKILETDASKFYGLFGWSEVGLAYFSVSLLALLLFPQTTLPWLALCNICCLPFSFWSIWYQKFRAKHWCTLCVSVQALLWLLFFSYLIGGWIKFAWPFKLPLFILGFTYLGVMLAINALMPLITRSK